MGNEADLVCILIAHSDEKARSALRMLLKQEPCLRVTGSVENGQELLRLAKSSRPDLVLLDWRLPGWPATDLVAALRTLDEGLKVIVLISRPELRQAAQAAGVNGIVNLWESPQKVLTAVLAAMCEDRGLLPKKRGADNLTVEGDESTSKT